MLKSKYYYTNEKLPKHLRNRNIEQITLRRDVIRLCTKYKETLTKKEMLSVLKDVIKAFKKYYRRRDLDGV